jgi:hypothetical protein
VRAPCSTYCRLCHGWVNPQQVSGIDGYGSGTLGRQSGFDRKLKCGEKNNILRLLRTKTDKDPQCTFSKHKVKPMPTAQNECLNDAGSTTRYGAEVAGGRSRPDVERAQVGDHTACAVGGERGRVAFAVLLCGDVMPRNLPFFFGLLITTVLAAYSSI